MKAKAILFVFLVFAASSAVYAQYHLQFDAEADRVLHMGGDTLRGNWCTRAEAEAYWNSQEAFERAHSSIVGSDCPNPNPPAMASEPSSSPQVQSIPGTNVVDTTRVENSAREADLERARKEKLARDHNELVRSLKRDTSTGATGLKTGTTVLPLKRSPGLRTFDATAKTEIALARAALENMDVATLVSIKTDIAQRQVQSNPWSEALRGSLKINAPPLPDKTFPQLQPGDVLLVAPEDDPKTGAFWTGHYIRLFDKLTSWEWDSYASHSCIYLKEVKGVRFFLDNIPGEGPRLKTEDEIIKEYGERYIDVARARRPGVAQPVSKSDAEKLWTAARELGVKQLNSNLENSGNYIERTMNWTNYGLYGSDNMVCSEASRFVLIKAGLDIPDTNSPFKKLLGIYFGPANFYSSEQYFLITPLAKLPNAAER
jgi:hypothetical protein